jgi:hypothetical protein
MISGSILTLSSFASRETVSLKRARQDNKLWTVAAAAGVRVKFNVTILPFSEGSVMITRRGEQFGPLYQSWRKLLPIQAMRWL